MTKKVYKAQIEKQLEYGSWIDGLSFDEVRATMHRIESGYPEYDKFFFNLDLGSWGDGCQIMGQRDETDEEIETRAKIAQERADNLKSMQAERDLNEYKRLKKIFESK